MFADKRTELFHLNCMYVTACRCEKEIRIVDHPSRKKRKNVSLTAIMLIWRDRWCFNNSRVSLSRQVHPPRTFHHSPPSFRALFLNERVHFARFPFSRTDYARVQIAAARRMAAKGYRRTSNYDQCVPFDLTTLFFAVAWQVQSTRDNPNKTGRGRWMGS